MAMSIGANDVANKVGPAVGAKAMSLTTAIAIAPVIAAGGAIKSSIIDPDRIADPQVSSS